VNIRSKTISTHCSTHDCIRGNRTQRGCELQLYLPQKIGNMDCTMCMDCVKACPHENVGITAIFPLEALTGTRTASRVDIAVVLLFVSFASLMNAAYMIAPVADRIDSLRTQHSFLASNLGSLLLPATAFCLFLLGWLTFAFLVKKLSLQASTRHFFCQFAFAVLPLGLAIWAAHLGFHLATSAPSIVPVFQHAYADLIPISAGSAIGMGEMAAMPASCRPLEILLIPGSKGINLFGLQLWVLDLGVLLSFYFGWRVIRQNSHCNRLAMASMWIAAAGALYAVGIWIFSQPMQMRGMVM